MFHYLLAVTVAMAAISAVRGDVLPLSAEMKATLPHHGTVAQVTALVAGVPTLFANDTELCCDCPATFRTDVGEPTPPQAGSERHQLVTNCTRGGDSNSSIATFMATVCTKGTLQAVALPPTPLLGIMPALSPTATCANARSKDVIVLNVPNGSLLTGLDAARLRHDLAEATSWTSSLFVTNRGEYSFPVQSVVMCDKDVSKTFSGSTVLSSGGFATLSMDTPCLQLPAEMLRSLALWANVSCARGVCVAPRAAMPPLRLLLATGAMIVDLNALVNQSTRAMCLSATSPITQQAAEDPPQIVIGYRVLASTVLIVEHEKARFGFVSPPPSTSDTAKCATQAECHDGHLYVAQSNKCLDVQCDKVLYKRLDHATQECRTVTVSMVFVILCAVAVVAVEAISTAMYTKLKSNVHEKVM
jgi:hypothetical protein